jgi:phage major head subunit gpT-like protein
MIVNAATVTALFTNFVAIFKKWQAKAAPQWQETAMLVPTTGLEANYDWLDLFPKMREWLGDKVVKALKAHHFTIVNKEWETTIAVPKKYIEADQLGLFSNAVGQQGFSSAQLPDEIISTLKNNAFAATSGLAYDGQYYYDSDHPVTNAYGVSSSVSNVGSAPLSAQTVALAAASFGAARNAIMAFTDDDGRPLGLVPDVLEVPPALQDEARLLMEADHIRDTLGSSSLTMVPNPYKGQCRVIVNPRLSSSTAWFLHCTQYPLKPYIYQERKAPQPVQQTGMETDSVFMRGEFKFGAEASANGGYGLWQLSYGSTGA